MHGFAEARNIAPGDYLKSETKWMFLQTMVMLREYHSFRKKDRAFQMLCADQKPAPHTN